MTTVRPVFSVLLAVSFLALSSGAHAQIPLPDAKPVPLVQVLPLPYDQASIQRDGIELTRYHFGAGLKRPFLYPIVGPGGRSLTRMGHPHDPAGHIHHYSVWVSHNSVNGEDFWGDRSPARIAHQRIVRYSDSDEAASIVAVNAWIGKEDKPQMLERRGITVRPMRAGDWMLTLDLQFEAQKTPVTLGVTPFGMVGVRMAKTIGVNDGGGLIRDSEGRSGEQGPEGIFHKRARWVDYSGPITRTTHEGITLFDHPSNPNHPTHFHVRGDGWMGASLTQEQPLAIDSGNLLRLRYGLYVHRGVPEAETVQSHWAEFAATVVEDLPAQR